jgi:hypothetical protein
MADRLLKDRLRRTRKPSSKAAQSGHMVANSSKKTVITARRTVKIQRVKTRKKIVTGTRGGTS